MNFKREYFLILLMTIKTVLCYKQNSNAQHFQSLSSDVNILDLSVNDIFNVSVMPVRIMTDQLLHILNNNYIGKEYLFVGTPQFKYLNYTDLNSAVEAMHYHRNMMKEYLLSRYLSSAIIKSTLNTVIDRRTGKAKDTSFTHIGEKDTNSLPTNHKLLEDEGSVQYSTWLKRMSTFDDVQKHLQNKNLKSSNQKNLIGPNRRQSMNINFESIYDDNEFENLEDGDVTGYAFANTPTNILSLNGLYNNHQKLLPGDTFLDFYQNGISKAGYDNGYDDYGIRPHPQANSSRQIKEIGLRDITDIALTTLAFLSFGMFILQVLMCITMNKDDTSSMVMLPMEGSNNGDTPVDDNTDEIRRKRRSVYFKQLQNIEMIDHLVKRALISLNAVAVFSKDNGACHYFALCKNNKLSRRSFDGKNILIPVWSLAVSWLSMKFKNYNKFPSANTIVDSLKAIMIGLNDGDCFTFYKNECENFKYN